MTAADTGRLGDGRIDNLILDSSVHVAVGVVVLVTMTAAAIWLIRLAVSGAPIGVGARLTLIAAQVALGVQILLGIKLLDQGQGTGQLYIHYLGGLAPLGLFLGAGWWPGPPGRRHTQVMAALVTVGWASAMLAFFVGRAYVNR